MTDHNYMSDHLLYFRSNPNPSFGLNTFYGGAHVD